VPLPFDNPFPNRWNSSNNGTNYEPCIAFSDSELSAFGIDSAAIEDIAQVDGQGTRGCHWFMPRKFGFGQVVTNSPSLSEYRNALSELDWKPDIVIEGRIVGVFDLKDDAGSCSTYVQSNVAAVITSITVSTSPDARLEYDACELVFAIVRAYIDKIPE
jgi:hypothetical protein